MEFVSVHLIPEGLPASGRLKIYALVDPRFDDVRYVGVTSRTLEERLRMHMRMPTNKRTRAWICELKAAGVEPRIVKIQGVNRNWQRAEMEWIAWFRVRGDLLNVDPGGELQETGTGWDDIKREKAAAAMNTARLEMARWSSPSCAREVDGKRAGKRRRKVPSTLKAHVQSIHPTVRKKKKDLNLDSLHWRSSFPTAEKEEKENTYGW